jgi:hypothetical protein
VRPKADIPSCTAHVRFVGLSRTKTARTYA